MLARTILVGTLANLLLAATALAAPPVEEGSVLPFPPVPSASVAGAVAAGIRSTSGVPRPATCRRTHPTS